MIAAEARHDNSKQRSISGMLMGFTWLSVLIVFCAIAVSYFISRNVARQQAWEKARFAIFETAESASELLVELKLGSELLANQIDIIGFCTASAAQRFSARDTVLSLLTSYANFRNEVLDVYLVTADGASFSAQPENVDANLVSAFTAYVQITDDYQPQRVFRSPILTELYQGSDGRKYFAQLFPIYRPIAAPGAEDYLGSLITICDSRSLLSVLNYSDSYATMIMQGNQLLSRSDETDTNMVDPVLLQSDGFQQPRREVTLSEPVKGSDWTVHLSYSVANSDIGMGNVELVCIILAAAASFAMFGLRTILGKWLVEPIAWIAGHTEKIQESGSKIPQPAIVTREIASLTRNLNEMLERIDELNDSVLKARLNYYQEHLMFLQTRTNPHFLYNNLESIRGMAAADKTDEVRSMISCIANIYRYGNRSEQTSTLREEYSVARDYEKIMVLRYGETFNVILKASDAALECKTPRMVLQPLIENAFLHGFLTTLTKNGTVEVNAEVIEDNLVIIVSDNGIGATDEKIEQLNQVPDFTRTSDRHIGISNLWKRLLLLFGAESNISVQRNRAGGLNVAIRINQIVDT